MAGTGPTMTGFNLSDSESSDAQLSTEDITMQLDEATLRRLWPQGDGRVAGLIAGIVRSSADVFARRGIATPQLVAHVMAQISHECGRGATWWRT
jgi:hypothetical protein